MKIKNRIIIFTLVISIISILSISTLNHFVTVKRLEVEINNRTQYETNLIARDLDKWISDKKSLLNELIAGMVKTDEFQLEYAREHLRDASKRNNTTYFIFFTDGEFIHPNLVPTDYDPSDRDWVIEAIKTQQTYVTNPYIDRETGGIVISISQAFTSQDGREGIIGSDLALDYISNYLDSASLREGFSSFLIDADRNFIIHENPEFRPTTDSVTHISTASNGRLEEILSLGDTNIRNRNIENYGGEKNLYILNL